jgi:hypothetical protein
MDFRNMQFHAFSVCFREATIENFDNFCNNGFNGVFC